MTACLQRLEGRMRRHITTKDVTTWLLTSGGAIPGPDDTWTTTSHIPVPPRLVSLVEADRATGRDEHTFDQILELLRQAGYSHATGHYGHLPPLLQHLGYGQWAVR